MNAVPYISDQGLRCLKPDVGAREHIAPARLLAPREEMEAGRSEAPEYNEVWQPIDRHEWAAGKIDGNAYLRCFLLSEAGEGKSTTCQWLAARVCASRSGLTAFVVNVADLPGKRELLLEKTLVDQIFNGRGSGNSLVGLPGRLRKQRRDEARRLLRREAAQGRLVLVFDGLDQGSSKNVKVLASILGDSVFQHCRIIVAGRPYALDLHWQTLFGERERPQDSRDNDWQFCLLERFAPEQQKKYLGGDRYELIPEEARPILSVPRVLRYLRPLDDQQFRQIRTPSDVFWLSTRKMLDEGIDGLPLAKQKQLDIDDAQRYLAAIAFTMIAKSDEPNFKRVERHAMAALECDVVERLKQHDKELNRRRRYAASWWKTTLQNLASLNVFIQHGLLEQNAPRQIQWRDRGLQEYFAGLWLSLYAPESDAQRLWDLVYLKLVPQTRAYLWMWRYAAEMPADARPDAKADPNHWARSLGVLYRPGDGTPQGTKRSNEIIYRSWETMNAYAAAGDKEALQARDDWLAEFEEVILQGNWTRFAERNLPAWGTDAAANELTWGRTDAKTRADQFKKSFVEIPAGQFRMGSPGNHPDRFSNEHTGVPLSVGKFALSRFPTLNAWFRLYDPGHGHQEWERKEYVRYSPTPNHPTIYVDWYTAWAFCQWSRWKGHSCELPNEIQWEYSAKGGADWRWNYWWGDAWDASRAAAELGCRSGRTSPLDPDIAAGEHPHDNPHKLRDMLGNMFEWTSSWYHDDPALSRRPTYVGSLRVLRGGAWDVDPLLARSACRYYVWPPAVHVHAVGFRVARAL